MFKPIQTISVLSSIAFAILVAGCQQQTAITGQIQDAVQGANAGDSNVADEATAVLAGGCFWCVESDFDKLPGVTDVVSGYSGGTNANPTYENYADGGHVEVVKVTYDTSQVTYAGLIEWLIKHSDPTDGKGSFGDRGAEYRPVVYYENDEQKAAAENVIAEIEMMNVYRKKLAIDVEKRAKFWTAEDYHQDYATNSLVKYDYYRLKSGRDEFIKKSWGDRAKKLELPESMPSDDESSANSLASASSDNGSGATKTDESENPWKDFEKPSQAKLKQELTDIQYQVTQRDGTERPYRNKYWDNKKAGIYVDLISGEPLFLSSDKYESGTGWPSFVRPLDSKFITLKKDNTLFTTRTEVRSKIGDSHLGHIFDDGPPDRGGKRWCMNSAALKYVPKKKMKAEGYGEYISLVESRKQ